ncbi:MAG: DUF1223 domain-containing protein [Acidobacteriaceae bacterium]|nr:DUF1223 domain-containing protein [Acidobacteriaceae bacterium]MBV9764187.1 DUF1223 domain-containing protein [Acidobacteriaceae bacterium]
MIRHLSLFVLALAATSPASPPEKTPVLLELFTSLGCSSCPPADKLLAEVDRQQPIEGAKLIVLSEHVDYWNTPAWSDPFSSGTCTERQQSYDSRFGVEVYTSQLVIDGTTALLGSNWERAASAIQRVMHEPTIPIHVTASRREGDAQVDIEVGPNSVNNKAVLFVALARDRAKSHVSGGENAGRDLSEVAVAYSIKQVGKISAGSSFKKSLSVSLPANSEAGDLRVIAFLRRSDTMQVIGADQIVF